MSDFKLAHKTILLTHPASENSDEFCALFKAEGANVFHFPMIAVEPIQLPKEILEHIQTSHFIIFTSKNGVKNFFVNDDIVNIVRASSIQIISIGQQTKSYLNALGIEVHFMPSVYNSDQLLSEIGSTFPIENQNVLLVLGEMAPSKLHDQLSKKNQVRRIDVYRTIIAEQKNEQLANLISNHKVDYGVFTSPSSFIGFDKHYKDYINSNLQLVSIGKMTSKKMKELGYNPHITAEESTYQGIYKSIIKNI